MSEETDKLLGQKIDALKELTDVKFNGVNDTLKRIEASTMIFVSKQELEEIKKEFTGSIQRIENGMSKHSDSDIVSFKSITDGQECLRTTLIKYGAIFGTVITIITFFSPFIYKYIFHVG